MAWLGLNEKGMARVLKSELGLVERETRLW